MLNTVLAGFEKSRHELVMRCVWQARDLIYNFANLLKSFKAPARAIMKKIKYVELDVLDALLVLLIF